VVAVDMALHHSYLRGPKTLDMIKHERCLLRSDASDEQQSFGFAHDGIGRHSKHKCAIIYRVFLFRDESATDTAVVVGEDAFWTRLDDGECSESLLYVTKFF
jgi:hypothetical protein